MMILKKIISDLVLKKHFLSMLKTFLLLCGNHETLFTGYFDEWKVEKTFI